jgi:hypothetical protein
MAARKSAAAAGHRDGGASKAKRDEGNTFETGLDLQAVGHFATRRLEGLTPRIRAAVTRATGERQRRLVADLERLVAEARELAAGGGE